MEEREIERMFREIKKNDKKLINVDREIGLIYSNEDLYKKIRRNEKIDINKFIKEINEIYFEVIYRSENKEELLGVFIENIINRFNEIIENIRNKKEIGITEEEILRDIRINEKYKCYNIIIRITKPIRKFLRYMSESENSDRIYKKYIELINVINDIIRKIIKDREIEIKWRTYYNNRINNKQEIEESKIEKMSYNIKKQYYKLNNKEIYEEMIYEEKIKNKIKNEFIFYNRNN